MNCLNKQGSEKTKTWSQCPSQGKRVEIDYSVTPLSTVRRGGGGERVRWILLAFDTSALE